MLRYGLAAHRLPHRPSPARVLVHAAPARLSPGQTALDVNARAAGQIAAAQSMMFRCAQRHGDEQRAPAVVTLAAHAGLRAAIAVTTASAQQSSISVAPIARAHALSRETDAFSELSRQCVKLWHTPLRGAPRQTTEEP